MPACVNGPAACWSYCASVAEEEAIESFMPDEYVEEVIAMDEECPDETDEVAEE